jgi:hypothetical protein
LAEVKAVPEFVPSMMASSAKEPFDSPDWIFESKLDGYRAIEVIDSTGKARLWSRNPNGPSDLRPSTNHEDLEPNDPEPIWPQDEEEDYNDRGPKHIYDHSIASG